MINVRRRSKGIGTEREGDIREEQLGNGSEFYMFYL